MTGPDSAHQRPEGVDDATLKALAKLSEAFEVIEDARGSLYRFHRLSGTADFDLGDAVALFREAGHDALAERIEDELLGRNVIPGHWTFQIVEGYDETYYSVFQELERTAREQLAEGKRHLYEAELKEQRRTHGAPGHEARPDDL